MLAPRPPRNPFTLCLAILACVTGVGAAVHGIVTPESQWWHLISTASFAISGCTLAWVRNDANSAGKARGLIGGLLWVFLATIALDVVLLPRCQAVVLYLPIAAIMPGQWSGDAIRDMLRRPGSRTLIDRECVVQTHPREAGMESETVEGRRDER